MVRRGVHHGLLAVLATAFVFMASPSTLRAHQSPFTYLDIRVLPDSLELSLIAHAFDVAHDIGVEQPEQIFDETTLRDRVPRMAALLADRMTIRVDGQPAQADPWMLAEALPQQQSVRFTSRVPTTAVVGIVHVTAQLFPYDPVHQTFVSFQERDVVASQAILDLSSRQALYYSGSVSGIWAAVRALTSRGFLHVVSGPEHIVMLVGLLLLGGARRTQLTIASAFVVGHLSALGLATFTLIGPPARLIEPALALAIVYVGTDNLMSSGGRDVRVWMSLTLGALHGFGFVPVLRAMALSRPALVWSLVAVNVGMAAAQLFWASLIGLAIARLQSRRSRTTAETAAHPARSWHWSTALGSVAVMALGALWFVQRVFFPGAGWFSAVQ